jgi:hypothetical protein
MIIFCEVTKLSPNKFNPLIINLLKVVTLQKFDIRMTKVFVDILASVCVITSIATGVVLHTEIHHTFVYNDTLMWTLHSVAALMLVLLIVVHGVQHKAWFKNYRKIPVRRKHVSTIMLVVISLLLVTGVALLCGSHSNFVSLFHFGAGILFTLLAIGHVARRFKIFRALLGI